MIRKRTFLTALPFAFLAACARAQGSQPPVAKTADLAGMSDQTLSDLVGGAGKVGWLNFAGTVRLSSSNGNVRPAKLNRAVMLNSDGTSARLFDVWQIGSGEAIAAPSLSAVSAKSVSGQNDAGLDSVWLSRAFTHPALQAPIEYSRLSRESARVMAIDATQIWLLEGGLSGSAPVLNSAAQAAFDAWQVG